MNPEHLRISLLLARYVEALDRDDHDTVAEICQLATTDSELMQALFEVDEALVQEMQQKGLKEVESTLQAAVEKNLPSAEVVSESTGRVTFADVAQELFRHPAGQLSPEAHQLNEKLRGMSEPLPENLAVPALLAWAEAKFGSTPEEYWRAFRESAIKVRMRARADVEFRMAARRKPGPEEPR